MTDNTNASELLPCPFCGGEPRVVQQNKANWAVMCHVCGAEGGWGNATDAIAQWNRRALESASQPGSGDEVSTIDQVMADCEAFEAAMVEAGHNRPDLGKYPGMYRYQRDQDRYTGWKLARAAPSAGNGEAKGGRE